MLEQKYDYCIENILGSKARIKILKILAFHIELSITSIISKTKLNHTIVLKHLDILKNNDLIQEKNYGRIRIFRYKTENIRARSLKKFIEIWESKIGLNETKLF
ncbi:MAG: winged helix-turn-helix domain-containing protein [Promethearchaeota archaeon]